MTTVPPSTAPTPSATPSATPSIPPVVSALAVEHLCDLRVDFFDAINVYPTPLGTRGDAIVRQAWVEGPRLTGQMLPGGGDWLVVGRDGVARLDIRATIRTHDGEMVYMTSTGRVAYDDDRARDRFLAGETVGYDDIYGRTAPLFETGSEAYGWLNRVVAVGVVVGLSLTHIHYQVYALA